MATQLTWLGHGTWLLNTGGHTLVVDPFLDDSPVAPVKSDQVVADYVLVSHGHGDHVADAAKIARRTGATVISNYEICEWLAKQGAAKTIGHNLGGGSNHPWGRVKLTLAHHSSSLPDGSNGGNPSGFLLTLAEGPKIYFACDTALSDAVRGVGLSGDGVQGGDRHQMISGRAACCHHADPSTTTTAAGKAWSTSTPRRDFSASRPASSRRSRQQVRFDFARLHAFGRCDRSAQGAA